MYVNIKLNILISLNSILFNFRYVYYTKGSLGNINQNSTFYIDNLDANSDIEIKVTAINMNGSYVQTIKGKTGEASTFEDEKSSNYTEGIAGTKLFVKPVVSDTMKMFICAISTILTFEILIRISKVYLIYN